ncbi:MAG: PucR family transcriptional regulator [Dorea sp.]|nr:PucR family transcriptional regulator [Dorea sp.]
MKKQATQIKEKLFEITVAGTFDDITELAYDLWGYPASIIDIHYHILSMYPSEKIENAVWDTIAPKKAVPDDLPAQLIEERYLESSISSKHPVTIDWGVAESQPRQVCRISIRNQIKGFISVVTTSNGWTTEDSAILESMANASALLFCKMPPAAYDESKLKTVFCSSLLKGQINTKELFLRWTKGLGISFKKRLCIFCIKPRNEEVLTNFLYIYEHVKRDFHHVLSVIFDYEIYIIYDYERSQDIDILFKQHTFEYYKKQNYEVGMSREFSDILQSKLYKKQAEKAITLGLADKSESAVYKFQDYILKNIYSCIDASLSIADYEHPAINILKKHDMKFKTEYYITLKEYICCLCSHSETINKLNIHRNTLRYRLQQIQNITGISLSDVDTCTKLLFIFKLAEYKLSLQIQKPEETGLPS